MDDYRELVETLTAGHKVKLVLMPNEPVQNATALFERLEREYGLTIIRHPGITNGRISFVLWSADHLHSEKVVGY